jgi:hypothetical protein
MNECSAVTICSIDVSVISIPPYRERFKGSEIVLIVNTILNPHELGLYHLYPGFQRNAEIF